MNETIEIDLLEFSRVLLKRAWLIVLCAVILGSAVLAYTVKCVTPMYTAQVKLSVSNTQGSVDSSNLAVALRLVNSYVKIITCDEIMQKTIDKLNLDMTPAQMRGMVSAAVLDETELFMVQVTGPQPKQVAEIANTIGEIAPGIISEIIPGSFATVWDPAQVPTGRSSPSYVTNALLGVLVGAVLAVVGVFIQMQCDVRIKDRKTLEKICGVAVLSVIPDFTESAKSPTKKAKR